MLFFQLFIIEHSQRYERAQRVHRILLCCPPLAIFRPSAGVAFRRRRRRCSLGALHGLFLLGHRNNNVPRCVENGRRDAILDRHRNGMLSLRLRGLNTPVFAERQCRGALFGSEACPVLDLRDLIVDETVQRPRRPDVQHRKQAHEKRADELPRVDSVCVPAQRALDWVPVYREPLRVLGKDCRITHRIWWGLE